MGIREKIKNFGKRSKAVTKSSSGKSGENVNSEKSGEKKSNAVKRPVAVRILFKAVKILFIRIPVAVIILIAVVLLAAKLYLTPQRVEQLAVSQFAGMSNGSLSLKVRKFDPYSDIWIENIIIKNPPEFGGNFAEIERIRLRYGFFSLFTGNIHFDEIGIYKPRIYLTQKKGVWNAAVLMKPSAPAEKKPEEKKESGEPKSEISLPISVNLLFNFVLDDLKVKIKGDGINGGVDDITFKTKIVIPPFRKIPLSPAAVSLLKEMSVTLNPDDRIDVSFYSPEVSVEPPLILGWSLVFDKGDGSQPKFNSRLRAGTSNTPIRFRKARLAPLDFLVSYDLSYDPVKDYLSLGDFGVSFKGKNWIRLAGSVSEASKKPYVNIRMAQSEIVLSDLYPYYKAITGDSSMRFGGSVTLAPLTIKGTPDAIAINGRIGLNSIAFSMPGFALNLPSADIGYGLRKNGNRGKIDASVTLSDFVYTLDRARSGKNSFSFSCAIDAFDDFKTFDIDSGSIRFFDPRTKETAFSAGLKGRVATAAPLHGNISVQKLYFMKDSLLPMLPDTIRKSMEGIPLSKDVSGGIDASFSLGKKTDANVRALFRIPDFDVNDLSLKADVEQDPAAKRVTVRNVSVESPSRGLTLGVKGFVDLKKAPLSDSDLSIALDVKYPKTTQVVKGINISGAVKMRAGMKGDLAKGKVKGSFDISNLVVTIPDSMLLVDTLNLSFPFEYDFAYKPSGGSRIAMDKSSVFDSALFKEKENFTVKAIAAKHPSRKEQFTYLKNLHGTLFFKKNAFEIQKLSANIMDGSMLMKDTFFYLSDLDIHNMEYSLSLDITNVDIGVLDQITKGRKDRSAELSMNAKLYGRDLDFKRKMNVNGSVNIYKIGDKFANKLMKGLSEQKGKSKLGIAQPAVDYGDIPSSFNYYVSEGTMYTDVYFKTKVVGYLLFRIDDNHIRFDRMPVQEYVKGLLE
jgi:hypothetical protein